MTEYDNLYFVFITEYDNLNVVVLTESALSLPCVRDTK